MTFDLLQSELDEIRTGAAARTSEKGTVFQSTPQGPVASNYTTSLDESNQFLHFISIANNEDRKFVRIVSPYLQNSWVYACTRVAAVNIAQTPYQIKRGGRDITDSSYPGRLFTWVSPILNRYTLMEGISTWLDTRGECFIEKVRADMADAPVVRQRFLVPDYMREKIDPATEDISMWVENKNGKKRFIDPDDIIHFKMFNPLNPYRGLAPLTASMLGLNSDLSAAKYNWSFLNNGSTMSGMITTEQNLDQTEADNISKRWDRKRKGLDKAWSVPVFGKGSEYKPIGTTQKDMMFMDMRKWTRQEVEAVLETPPAMIGHNEEASIKSNIKEQLAMFFTGKLIPRMRMIEEQYYTDLFDKEKNISDCVLDFQISELAALKDAIDTRATTAETLVRTGYDINDVNEKLELGLAEVAEKELVIPAVPKPKPADKPTKSIDTMTKIMVSGKSVPMDKKALDLFGQKKRRELDKKTTPIKNEWAKDLREKHISKIRHDVLDLIYNKDATASMYTKGVEGYNDTGMAAAKKIIIKTLTEDMIVDFQPDWEALDASLVDMSRPFYTATFKVAGTDIADSMGVNFDVTNARATAAIETKSIDIVEANRTIKDQLTAKMRPVIKDGIERGLNYENIQAGLKEACKGVTTSASHRMATVAKTEVNGTLSQARDNTMEDLGIEKTMWVSSKNPSDPRPDHAAADGEIAKRGETFSTGLLYPLEPGAPAEDVINCGCIHIMVA